jgi:hypothetical protein
MTSLSWTTISGPIAGTVAVLAIVLLVTSELRRAQGRPRPLLVDHLSIAIGAAALLVACARPVIG